MPEPWSGQDAHRNKHASSFKDPHKDSENLGSNPAFTPCQSTSRLPAVLVSHQPPNHHLMRQPWAVVPAHECISSSCPACRQVGRQGRRDPRRGTAARNPSYFSEPDHVLKQRCESFFSAHTAKAPASPLPHPISYLSGPQPQQCLRAMVQTRLGDKSFIFFFLSSPWC